MSLWPSSSSAFDPFHDPFFDMAFPMSRFQNTLGIDVSNRFPRHVGSRVIQTADGDLLWRPATDIYETDKDIVVHCDLPGGKPCMLIPVPKDDINIDVSNDELIIQGNHKGVEGYESASSRVRERAIGRFRKIVRLPAGVEADKVEAKAENGLLEVKIPKTQDFSHKRISLED